MATYTQRVTTTGTKNETQEASQRVAAKLREEGFVVTGASQPFQDPEHTSSPDPAGFWSVDLYYDKGDNVSESVVTVIPAPAAPKKDGFAPMHQQSELTVTPEETAAAENEGTPPGTEPSRAR